MSKLIDTVTTFPATFLMTAWVFVATTFYFIG